MIKVGSDFSGVGAFNQALIRLGIEYDEVFACDMDKFARETFIHNYGEPKYYPKDVYDREIAKESLDIYMTSPPCQAFSLAGKRLGKEDKRGVLFFNSHQFIKTNKPRYFIFENVKGLLSDDNGNTFKEWINMLGGKSVNGLPVLFPYEDSVPYHIYYKVMNAKKHGVPQNRERVFIIGIRDDQDNYFRWAKEEHLTKRLKDVLENEVDDKYFLSKKMLSDITYLKKSNGEVANLNKGGERGSVYTEDTDIMSCLSATDYKQPKQIQVTNNKRVNQNYNKHKDTIEKGDFMDSYNQTIHKDITPTITSRISGSHNYHIFEEKQIRRLTPRECFRLMDFPDTFTWMCSDSQAYKQAGNSIVVRCLELIIKEFNLNATM